jgi:hypothetical protein
MSKKKQKVMRRSGTSKLEQVEKMIGNIIRESQMFLSKDQLRRGLGSQVRKSDFNKVLRNLENSKKITYSKGSIIWISEDNNNQTGQSTPTI